jgi:hypothetical protein
MAMRLHHDIYPNEVAKGFDNLACDRPRYRAYPDLIAICTTPGRSRAEAEYEQREIQAQWLR